MSACVLFTICRIILVLTNSTVNVSFVLIGLLICIFNLLLLNAEFIMVLCKSCGFVCIVVTVLYGV